MTARESDPFPWLDPAPRGMTRILGRAFLFITLGSLFGVVLGCAALVGGAS